MRSTGNGLPGMILISTNSTKMIKNSVNNDIKMRFAMYFDMSFDLGGLEDAVDSGDEEFDAADVFGNQHCV